MAKVPLSNSFLERRDARRKFSESLGAGASLAPRTCQRISPGSENHWKFRLRSCQSWKASSLRRFAAVSPFCFGYHAQPDIASWRICIRIKHNHFDRPTFFFATRPQGRYPRSLEAFFFTPVDFLSVSSHDSRAPLERTKDVDFRRVQLSTECMMPESEEWIRRKRRRRRSIDEQASGCMVDLLNLSRAVLCGRQCDLSFFCAGGPGEWAVVRLLRRRWTPAQDSYWSRQRRLLNVDLVSVLTIS